MSTLRTVSVTGGSPLLGWHVGWIKHDYNTLASVALLFREQLALNEKSSLFIKERFPEGRVTLQFLQTIQAVVHLLLLLGGLGEALLSAHGLNLHQYLKQAGRYSSGSPPERRRPCVRGDKHRSLLKQVQD